MYSRQKEMGSAPNKKTEESTMKEYTIYYIDTNGTNCVGGGYGKNEQEALKDFGFWHEGECKEIKKIEEYR